MNTLLKNVLPVLGAVAALAVAPTRATAITLIGQVAEIFPPLGLLVPNNPNYESNDEIFFFEELSNYTLPDDVEVNFTQPGLYESLTNPGQELQAVLPTTTISAGTLVNSYFLYGDAEPESGEKVLYSGSVTFDDEIIGIILDNSLLQASQANAGLQAPGTFYPPGTNVSLGTNLDPGRDSITLSADGKTIGFDLVITDFIDIEGERVFSVDQIRVLTVAEPLTTPEPSGNRGLIAFSIFGIGLVISRQVKFSNSGQNNIK